MNEPTAASLRPGADTATLDAEARRRLAQVQRTARLLDSQFRFPGTNRTFGLDPLIGLIPGIGGSAGLVLSTMLIVQAIRAGARPPTVIRMVAIAGADAVISTIPVIGTVADFVIKANQRNARILAAQALEPDRTTEQSRRMILLTALTTVVAVFLLAGMAIVGLTLLLQALF